MDKKLLNPVSVSPPVGNYAHGVLVSNAQRMLFISGQIPAAPDGSIPKDFENQARNCWRNIENILKEAGMDFTNLVKTTTFLTDHKYLAANRLIRNEMVGDVKCASSAIVAATLLPEWLLEIEAIAVA